MMEASASAATNQVNVPASLSNIDPSIPSASAVSNSEHGKKQLILRLMAPQSPLSNLIDSLPLKQRLLLQLSHRRVIHP